MQIWVDADACPNVIKEVLFRAADRTATLVTLVANQPLRTPPSKYLRTLQVAAGFDVADNEIVRRCEAGDLVITADIPLAAEVIEKRRGGAESARRALYPGHHSRAAQYARFYGYPARQRHSDRRPERPEPARPSAVRQRAG
ncbi:Uncharacterized BCR, YaiI/YqxD family COG1671 [Serratia rubidaea]|uniref:Uncharacterized BCR, YaiI/YqxD family COG1671 n=1 Tax=Serratia rubidaea TaxID=61652 RepID=A0A4U9HN12_SERRU|nr:Uncharacterized BCR, YaiI/YqxD family COG1671 [Serratia rubidaea]